MFFGGSAQDGAAVTVFRRPSQIRKDIRAITSEIKEAERSLNVRHQLVEFLYGCVAKNPSEWMAALEEVMAEVEEGMHTIELMEESLGLLCRELEAAKCLIQ